MKILHFKTTMCLEEGGVVKAVLDLVRMGADSDQIGLATLDPSGIPTEWLRGSAENISVHNLKSPSGPGSTLTRKHRDQLGELINEYDVVHLHSIWTTANPQIARLCSKLNKPYVLSVHGMLDDWCMSQRKLKKMLYMRTWGRNLLRDATVIHCTAQAELDQASQWFDIKKGMVAPLPIDLSEYQCFPDSELAYQSFNELDREKPKVLFLSRIHYKKGVDRLIRASALLSEMGVEHQLVIAGTGDNDYVEQMKDLAREVGVESQTYFLGFATGAAKVALFNACQVFALPTSQENFGFVFFESLAGGTPVVTTKGTDTWPEIERSGGGIIVDNTSEAFADLLSELLSHPTQTMQMGATGRAWVYRELSICQIKEYFISIYNYCLILSQPVNREFL